ncbi:MAG: D-glycero-beta-D-manno-heptose-7-phosphate kinase, partial [Acidobacteria bacterium]
IGVIGTDEAGRALLEEFARRGIDAHGVVSQESRVTTVKTRIVAHHQQVCRADRETRTPVVGETLMKLLEVSVDLVRRCRAAILSDYLKGLLVAPLVDRLVESTRKRNVFLAVDPKAEDFCIYRGASIITPNKREQNELQD